MKIQSPTPKGIDYVIQQFQNWLHTQLIARWGLSDVSTTDWLCYDRAYKNQKTDGYVPEVYLTKNEYKEVLLDDKVKVTSFFGVGDTIEVDTQENQNVANVHLIFFVNLKKLKVTDARPDEITRQDVQYFCNQDLYGFTLEGIQTGIEAVLSDYPGFMRESGMKHRDMNPFHCFRFNFSLRYDYDKHEC
ncbi:MAG TPA: hypothetical protein VGF79_00850 [Bacteroidia bacterium]